MRVATSHAELCILLQMLSTDSRAAEVKCGWHWRFMCISLSCSHDVIMQETFAGNKFASSYAAVVVRRKLGGANPLHHFVGVPLDDLAALR